jgi:hypothetical protein
MTARPRTIQIFLPTGDPRGIQVAALTTSIVQVIEVPRPLLSDFLQMPESRQVGVYYLIGDDEEKDQLAVYVGQTGSLGKRLSEHDLDPKREFWNRALVAISLTHSLTQTHAMYLEWRSIQQANAAQRYTVENGTVGTRPHTPAWLEADCQEIFDTIRTLVSTLGQQVFEPLAVRIEPALPVVGGNVIERAQPPELAQVFRCFGPQGADATGQYTEEGMVVLKGSRARCEAVASLAEMWAGRHRQRLVEAGDLILDAGSYVFQRDVLFRSPSGASSVVLGRTSNGWTEWRDPTGQTLDALKRQRAEATEVI